MSLVKRAIWVIERNLDQELSLVTVADACSVSSWHLSHAFTTQMGKPVMEYIRSRRLTLAAEKLSGGWSDILDLALASGYGSHEAFTRAFSRLFCISPEEVRKRGNLDGLPLTRTGEMTHVRTAMLPGPTLRDMPDLTLNVLSGHFSLAAMHGIPELWREFMMECPSMDTAAQLGPVGVMGTVADDGSFDYACGAPVRASSPASAPFTRLQVPAHRCAIFLHTGHVSTIRGTYAQIWDHALLKSGWTMANHPSIEVHASNFDPQTGDGGVAIWVPIQDRAVSSDT